MAEVVSTRRTYPACLRRSAFEESYGRHRLGGDFDGRCRAYVHNSRTGPPTSDDKARDKVECAVNVCIVRLCGKHVCSILNEGSLILRSPRLLVLFVSDHGRQSLTCMSTTSTTQDSWRAVPLARSCPLPMTVRDSICLDILFIVYECPRMSRLENESLSV